MNEVIAWVVFVGAWLLVAGPLYQGSVELGELDIDREGIEGDQGIDRPDGAAGSAVGVVVAAATGHVRAAPPLEQGVPAGHICA